MASTNRYTDALNCIARKIPRIAEDNYAAVLVNMAMERIWRAGPFRETLAKFPPFHVLPLTQDYPSPLIEIPSDYHGLYSANIGLALDHFDQGIPLLVRNNLQPCGGVAVPAIIGNFHGPSGFGGIRLHPRPSASMVPPNWVVWGDYKKRFIPVANNTLTDVIPFDDSYFGVLIEGVTWAGYKLSGSQEQDAQFERFRGALAEMLISEGLMDGESTIHPAEALAY